MTLRDALRQAADAVADALEKRDGWFDQDNSPLGKRRHLEAVRAGKLPAVKQGRLRLVKHQDMERFLTGEPSVDADVQRILDMVKRHG